MDSLTNRSAVKNYIWERVKELRPDLANDVSQIEGDYCDQLDHAIRVTIDYRLKIMKKSGKTIRYGEKNLKF